jgi:hypothetical protein
MPRLSQERLPKLRRQENPNGSDRAFVALDGRRFYVGPWGSPEAETEYKRLVGEWLSNGRMVLRPFGGSDAADGNTVDEVLAAYLTFAETYYRKNGVETSELYLMKYAMGPVAEMYGDTSAASFDSTALLACRDAFVRAEVCREKCNHHVSRIRRIFRWAVQRKLVPPGVLPDLGSVAPLQMGRSDAPEMEPVRPVPDEWIEAIRPYLSRQVAAMLDVQRLSGLRPGNVVALRACEIDMTGEVVGGKRLWVHVPASHKTEHRGRELRVLIGPRVQSIIRSFLKSDSTAYLFSPADAVDEKKAAKRAARAHFTLT